MDDVITLGRCRNTAREDGLMMKTVMGYTFPDLMEAVSSRYCGRTCYRIFNTDISFTFGQLKEYSYAISSYLLGLGIDKGDRIAIIGESSPMWMLMYLGIVSIGAIAVPILPDFAECDIKNILMLSKVRGIAASRKYMHKVKNIDNVPIFRLDDLVYIPPTDGKADGMKCFSLTECAIDSEGIAKRHPEEQDTASIIFTSGTTGSSKGVMLSHLNLIRCADLATDEYVRLKPGMKVLSILPMAHVYEFSLGQLVPLMMGLEITFLGRQPAPSIVMEALSKVRPHIMFSVPLLIEKVYRSAILPLIKGSNVLFRFMNNPFTRPLAYRIIGHALRKKFGGRIIFFGIGGAPLDREAEDFLHKARFPYAIGYGLTETSPLIAGCKPTYRSQKPGFIGKIVKDDEVMLISINEEGIGEVAVKGPNIMKGYYMRPDLDSEAFTERGYFRTGDLGYIDEKGQLSIKGRVKTMILGPGGENIYPEAIESIINNQEYVEESLVIPEDGGLVALVRLNLEQMQKKLDIPTEKIRDCAMEYLTKMKIKVNSSLSTFSKLSVIREQNIPFERTPTLKIKRFLYDGSC